MEQRPVSEASCKVRWPRAIAIHAARELCALLTPHCEKIIVAGSLRRRKQEVGDVEILFVPRVEEQGGDFFTTCAINLADIQIGRLLSEGVLSKRPSKAGAFAWGEKNKLGIHSSGVPVDLFRTTSEAWFNYLVCRTGPAASNARIATEARRRGYRWNPYGPGFTRLSDGFVAPMDSEESVFAFVGLPFRKPWDRD